MIRIREIGFKSGAYKSAYAVVVLAMLALGACGREDKGWRHDPTAAKTEQVSPQAGYLKPPRVLSAVRQADGVALSGQAEALASVRLGAPTGEALVGKADAAGAWRLVVPLAAEPRLYGLSMTIEDRTVQAQGYLMVTPKGAAVLLRAGAGAEVMGQTSPSPRILAIDYDRGGGAVVSGVGTPGAGLGVRVDRTTRGEGKVGEDGRFSISLDHPLETGTHAVQVAGEGGEQLVIIDVSPALPPSGGPVRSTLLAAGWRVDWMNPGGGLQSTQLLDGAQ
ncbi:Ig-like domain-containing protein [Caulobacter soli]|uniref:Ig-like domain-containing protein n=1 Tax=Caulobacter soli TaxID=2708539 RepID=UPI0013EC4B1D|nr:Ig-like domain-containing protein [Caulobacter soli]